jgi:hypothetical protein
MQGFGGGGGGGGGGMAESRTNLTPTWSWWVHSKEKKESKLWYQLLHVSREIDHPPAANHWKESMFFIPNCRSGSSRDSQFF